MSYSTHDNCGARRKNNICFIPDMQLFIPAGRLSEETPKSSKLKSSRASARVTSLQESRHPDNKSDDNLETTAVGSYLRSKQKAGPQTCGMMLMTETVTFDSCLRLYRNPFWRAVSPVLVSNSCRASTPATPSRDLYSLTLVPNANAPACMELPAS